MAAIKCITVLSAVLATPATAELMSIVSTIEQRNFANADLISEIKTLSEVHSDISEPTPLRSDVLAELRAAREEAKPQPSAARLELLAELKGAREQAEWKPKPSAMRMDLMAELRAAREQAQPKPSAVRLELLSELRAAREQAQPKPSATRQTLLEELRGAREQEQAAVATPSAVRNELLSELRAAREEAMLEKFLDELESDEEPALAQTTAKPSAVRSELLSELHAAREEAMLEKFLEELESDEEPALAQSTAQPSAVRSELLSELRAARETEMLDKFLDELELDEVEAPVYTDADELPWDDSEELLDSEAQATTVSSESDSAAEQMDALNKVLRTLLVSAVALGMAAAAKLPELDLKQMANGPSQWVTLSLFFVPLVLVSADYAFDMAVGNEFGLISACWGLAAMAACHLRGKEEKIKVAL